MFGGSFTHSLDSAGRFVMPMKIRLELGSEFIITKGVGCLCVFTREYARGLEDSLNQFGGPLMQLLNPDVARLHRHFFSEMVEVGSDKQFRVQLTPEHRRYAGIEDEVVICGCGKYVELWSPAALEAYRQQNEGVENLTASGMSLLMQGRAAGGSDAGVSQTGSI